MSKNIFILYDEKCRFCTRFAHWATEKNSSLAIVPIRSKEAKQLLKKRGAHFIDLQTVYFIKEEKVNTRSLAIFNIAYHLPFPYRLLSVFKFLPRSFTDYCYKIFAKYRTKF